MRKAEKRQQEDRKEQKRERGAEKRGTTGEEEQNCTDERGEGKGKGTI